MQSRRRIRSQMHYGVAMLLIVVVILSIAAFWGVAKFRTLTKSIRTRSAELPLVARLSQEISDLRATYSKSCAPPTVQSSVDNFWAETGLAASSFRWELRECFDALHNYQQQLEKSEIGDHRIADMTKENEAVEKIDSQLGIIIALSQDELWIHDEAQKITIYEEIDILQTEVSQLPGYLKDRMDGFAELARAEYRTLMVVSGLLTAAALIVLFFLVRRFHLQIFSPLETLLAGARSVAAGNYDHRVDLKTNDEMAELAQAFNETTQNFQEIRRDLNQQVKQRTREIVRSEKMASVGFLAAGVAHEINNPLAAIAWSAESLEMRLHDILNPSLDLPEEKRTAEIDEMKKYLRRIQDEAFRCKGITSGLLDYSRSGDAVKTGTNLGELIEGVVEMLSPLSKYRSKKIEFDYREPIVAEVDPQEIKQVILNLVTNALDSIDESGRVKITLQRDEELARISVIDNGCGMTSEVLKHLFEPFFTKGKEGQGTGLGLSITYRIIEEHGGTIVPASSGPGLGARFDVTLPLVTNDARKVKAA